MDLLYIKLNRPFYIEAFNKEKAKRPIIEIIVINLDLKGYIERI